MISGLFAKYQFGAIGLHNADITDGKVANRALIPANLRYSVIYSRPLFALFNHQCIRSFFYSIWTLNIPVVPHLVVNSAPLIHYTVDYSLHGTCIQPQATDRIMDMIM